MWGRFVGSTSVALSSCRSSQMTETVRLRPAALGPSAKEDVKCPLITSNILLREGQGHYLPHIYFYFLDSSEES